MCILDVSSWREEFNKQASGTRVKYWIIDPQTSHEYMFKIPRENTGEAWAEKISSEIGKLLGLSMVDVHLAVRKNIYGIIAKKFTSGTEEFYEGGDLITSIVDEFDRYKLDYYNFENISKVLKEFQLDKEFVAIPIFDALIGNQDRHCDNWGIIRTKTGYRLAPIYDNGASLGFQLKEERIKLMLKDSNMFKAFTNRSYSLIGIGGKKKPKHMELLSVIRKKYPKEVEKEMDRLVLLDRDNVIHLLNTIPSSIMSDIYKEWVEKLLLFRKEWILTWRNGSE
ncbi:HipA domain-containing protein [Fervidibacillus halotolerans]|uniref:HipA domain-containing protein n=1 Tax=Fervidibacillus halotolerans TaxID=2980027 RepID=A0A9E8LZU8_9BACI|nr:HipA domain-containing protein [Fervidibacillus halotolerans]WAA12427.1 HipA domain-containing protein [Fervidibacillus halotolerans]